MRAYVRSWIQRCATCRMRKDHANPKPVRLRPMVVTSPWHTVHMDFRGPLPPSPDSYRYLIVFIDAFTHWVEYAYLKKITAVQTSAAFLEQVIARHGCP